jgi:hypothetical protein
LYQIIYNVTFRQSSVPIFIYLLRLCLSFPSCTNTIKKLLGKQFKTLIKTHKRYQSKKHSLIKKKKKKRE